MVFDILMNLVCENLLTNIITVLVIIYKINISVRIYYLILTYYSFNVLNRLQS